MRLQTFLFAGLLAGFPLAAISQTTSHARAELLSESPTLIPGKPVTLGVHFTIDKGWHIYWKNPGDAGLATSIAWKLPPGFKTGRILWPVPEVISLPSVTDFGYENEVLLMVPVTVPKNLDPAGSFKFSAKVQWLVCRETCVPGSADLHLKISAASGAPSPSASKTLFSDTRQNLPVRLPAAWKPAGTLDSRQFQLAFQTRTSFTRAYFFPSIPDQIDNSAPQHFQPTGSGFTLTVKRSDQLLANVQKLEGLLVVEDNGKKKGYEAAIPLSPSN